MESPCDGPLLTDADGYRYFIAELEAFKIFGPAFDERRLQLDPMMKEWLLNSDRLPELRAGADRLRQVVSEVSDEAQSIMKDIMGYIDSREDPAEEDACDDGESDADDEPTLPHGHIKVLIGERRKKVTDHQRRLFDWLREHQQNLVPDVRARLSDVYREVCDDELPQFGEAPAILNADA